MVFDNFDPAANPFEPIREASFIPYDRPRPNYKTIGKSITVSMKETQREELRITVTQRDGEDAPRVDLRYFTIRSDGRDTPHRGGLRLTLEEAAQLRDALDKLDL